MKFIKLLFFGLLFTSLFAAEERNYPSGEMLWSCVERTTKETKNIEYAGRDCWDYASGAFDIASNFCLGIFPIGRSIRIVNGLNIANNIRKPILDGLLFVGWGWSPAQKAISVYNGSDKMKLQRSVQRETAALEAFAKTIKNKHAIELYQQYPEAATGSVVELYNASIRATTALLCGLNTSSEGKDVFAYPTNVKERVKPLLAKVAIESFKAKHYCETQEKEDRLW
jgi:hypothetical protein